MEQDHADFVEEYADLTQAFMDEEQVKWDRWFAEKQDELDGDVAGNLQLQIDDLRTKVHNMALKFFITRITEQITAAVTVTLINSTTGTRQQALITDSGIAFYITE